MDQIEKFLCRLDKKRRLKVGAAIERVYTDNLTGLAVQKLQGFKNTYRVRIGDIRIIFIKTWKSAVVIDVEQSGDTTYR